jgi:hypothetical protein
MEPKKNRTLTQCRAPSLIEFLLGNGTHPGWLDKQSHHTYAGFEQRCPYYSGDRAGEQVAISSASGDCASVDINEER